MNFERARSTGTDPDKELLEALQDHRRFAANKDLKLASKQRKIARLEDRKTKVWQRAKLARQDAEKMDEIYEDQSPLAQKIRGNGGYIIRANVLEWYAERLEAKAERLLFGFDAE